MKGLIIKVAMMLFIVIGISNYLIYIKTGKSPFADLGSGLSFADLKVKAPSLPAGKQKAYKWVDEHGVTHYSSEAPPEQMQAQVLEVDPQQNIIQGIEIKAEQAAEPNQSEQQPVVLPANPYNPETVRQLIDDAKAVQQTLNQRYEDLDKVQ
ncbi:DUF4124 domain-containing protein [Agaribacterium haliotis]|uniref:DUF4124 domain-containing protein n=1 Tax=Agaribacterium haliotis TaxID=2013869 RepID=UPI000BB5709E|nr:DUF4124 domain-containing protein [Agaribacterium haliotis]